MAEKNDLGESKRRRPQPGRGGLTDRQLRQRRSRILKDKIEEQQEQDNWQGIARDGDKSRGRFVTRLYAVILTALVVTVIAILNYTRPAFLFRRKKAPPPLYMATIHPPNVVMDRDLPRFFQTYSIATPNNKDARNAAVRVVRNRQALNNGTGRLKVVLKAWDATTINQLVERDICGQRFSSAYLDMATNERQSDLVMWCLLTTRITEGFFQESVEMLGNAFLLNQKRGIVVRKSDGRISNAFYLHPRLPGEMTSDTAPLPMHILSWLLDNPESALSNPIFSLQDKIAEYIFAEEHRDRYMYLDEVCQDSQPSRAIARQCLQQKHPLSHEDSQQACCYFVVPEAEGGTIRTLSSEAKDRESKGVRA